MNAPDKARRLADDLQVLLEEVQRADRRRAEAIEGLSPQELRVLSAVADEPRCVMGAIARRICLSLSGATGLIDRLVEKRLVKRDRSAEDRRVVEVELTDEGRELSEEAAKGRVELARDLLRGLAPREQEELLALLGKAAARVKSERAAV